MKLILAAILLLSVTLILATTPASQDHTHEVETEWNAFKGKHKKAYGTQKEHENRKAIFAANHERIHKHNSNANKTYSQGYNFLSDLSEEEKKSYMGYNHHQSVANATSKIKPLTRSKRAAATTLPTSLDLRTSSTPSCIGPVKNQGSCGSCYAFSAIAALEYSYCMAHNRVYVSLSEQQIVDCDRYNGGCFGGNTAAAWLSLYLAGGSEPTSVYPYLAKNGPKCFFIPNNVKVKVIGAGYVGTNVFNIMSSCRLQHHVRAHLTVPRSTTQ